MKWKHGLGLAGLLACLLIAPAAQAGTHQRFALVLDFSTCVLDSQDSNIMLCKEADASGKVVGTIKVTFQANVNVSGSAATWHEKWEYTLDGGTITVDQSVDWQAPAPTQDETGFSPTMGYGKGTITGATGKYSGATGRITMRWDDFVCICLFEIDQ